MGCLSNIAKYILFGVNAYYTIVAIILVALGAIILIDNDVVPEDIYLQVFMSLVMFIVSGCLLFLISLFGCCGVIAEKTFLLISYIILIILLICVKIYIAIEIRAMEFSETIEYALNNVFDDVSLRETFSVLETIYNCCGTTGADSYKNLNETLPITCCPLPNVSDADEPQLCSEEDAYTGCIQVLSSTFNSILSVLFYAVISIIVVEAVSIILASYLIHDISKKKKVTTDTSVHAEPTRFTAPSPQPQRPANNMTTMPSVPNNIVCQYKYYRNNNA